MDKSVLLNEKTHFKKEFVFESQAGARLEFGHSRGKAQVKG